MTVYLDDVRHIFGEMIMCHMWADTEAELFEMADSLGLKRNWVQGHPESTGKGKGASWVHFDVSYKKKQLALRFGAVLTDRYGPLTHLARQDIASGDPIRIKRGEARLTSVARARDIAMENKPWPHEQQAMQFASETESTS